MLPTLKEYLSNEISILDIGCGKGQALKDLQSKYEANIVGTTLESHNTTGIPIYSAYADGLPFKDGTFDIVISVHGISWEPNQIQAIKEAVRVLKPGGTAHIYLIKFSHSIALFLDEDFWEDFDHVEYSKKYEFDPDITIQGCHSVIKQLEFPNEECNGYFKEWQIFLKKQGL